MGEHWHVQLQTLVVATQVIAVLCRQFRCQRVRADAELPQVVKRLAPHTEADPRLRAGGRERRRNYGSVTVSCSWVLSTGLKV